jgi:hypothetical protein
MVRMIPMVLVGMALAGCDRGSEAPAGPAEAQEPGGSLVDQSGPREPGKDGISTSRPQQIPGLPSLSGTDTTGMPAADAAAQRLIDAARLSLKDDPGKARTHLGNLRQMYDQLTPTMKEKVDALAREVEGGAATRP